MSLAKLLTAEDWRDAARERADLVAAAAHAAMLENGLIAVDTENGNEKVTDARLLREWQSQEVARMSYTPAAGGSVITLTLVRLGDVVVTSLVPSGSVRF